MAWLILAAVSAQANEEDEVATYAVQNRRFGLGHELSVGVGLLPLNAFSKGLTVGGGYTYHLSHTWAWEVVGFAYSYGLDTGLKKELLENFEVEPTQIEAVRYFASSSLVVKPLYGKFAWLNRSVVHAEVFLALGGGVGRYQNPAALRGALDAGLGLRLHMGPHSSVRLDLRDYAFFPGLAAPVNELHVALSWSLSFGGKDK